MSVKGLIRLLLLPLSLLAGLPAGGAQPADPVRIGVTGPYSGSNGVIGLSMREGIRIAAAQINAEGGVLGRRLVLVERDDQSSNERGAQIAQTLIQEEGIVAAVGLVSTGVALASQHLYQRARIPMLTAVAGGSLITRQFQPPEHLDNFIFRTAPSDTLHARRMVEEAVNGLHAKRLAIFHDATNYGQLGRDDLLFALQARQLQPAAVERLPQHDAEMLAALHRVHQAGADALLVYGSGAGLARIASANAKLGLRLPLIGSWPFAVPGVLEGAERTAEGVRIPQSFIPAGSQDRRQAFLEAWRRTTGTDRIPVPPAAAQGYDALLLLAAAIRQAGSTEGDRIRDALENLRTPVEGVVMIYDRPFSRDNHETFTHCRQLAMGEVRQGQVMFAYDEERKRATRQ
ncbi:ABC transporter substrate-binding protein [Azoarcus indigens]|uniref:Amino acid/amide ABC transporter substrate-binding protein (HAAT family) n=1 Tax=Azoarcus indigens TaxID=29545 RepID=A0A4R6E122_9RHOO|nr:ABC transporter substrate-binding protein [Azoarcus indigens]NMG64681.1 ABC transporter substrate-binding protein [Azoarcus indigens]TDN50934.1 amino acid/amide ABC transporter substrate-binding protein (HAAT family) [Azoarcus indigens]